MINNDDGRNTLYKPRGLSQQSLCYCVLGKPVRTCAQGLVFSNWKAPPPDCINHRVTHFQGNRDLISRMETIHVSKSRPKAQFCHCLREIQSLAKRLWAKSNLVQGAAWILVELEWWCLSRVKDKRIAWHHCHWKAWFTVVWAKFPYYFHRFLWWLDLNRSPGTKSSAGAQLRCEVHPSVSCFRIGTKWRATYSLFLAQITNCLWRLQGGGSQVWQRSVWPWTTKWPPCRGAQTKNGLRTIRRWPNTQNTKNLLTLTELEMSSQLAIYNCINLTFFVFNDFSWHNC